MAVINPEALKKVLRSETQKTFAKAGAKVAAVGVSGGVNSALALGVAADALGPENVAGVYIGAHSNPESFRNASLTAKAVGVNLVVLDVTADVDSIWSQFKSATERGVSVDGTPTVQIDKWPAVLDNPKGLRVENRCTAEAFQAAIVARGSLRSCIRATVLDAYGKTFAIQRALERKDQDFYSVVIMGTGDEGEDRFFRFFNKRGDGAVDVSLLSGLAKNEHRQAAVKCYGIPREVAYQKSGPDLQHDVLLPGQLGHFAEHEMSRVFGALLTYGSINPATDMYATYGTLEWIAREDDKRGVVTGTYWASDDLLGHYKDQRLVDVVLAARKFNKSTLHKTATQATIERKVFLDAGAIKDGPDSDLPVNFEV